MGSLMDRPEWRGARPASVQQIGGAEDAFSLARIQTGRDSPVPGDRSGPIRKLPALY